MFRPVRAFLKICSKPRLQYQHGSYSVLAVHAQLQDGEIDGRVETETALVGAESRVELDSVASVDGERTVVPLPGDTELDHSLGDLHDIESALVFRVSGKQLRQSVQAPKTTAKHVRERWWP